MDNGTNSENEDLELTPTQPLYLARQSSRESRVSENDMTCFDLVDMSLETNIGETAPTNTKSVSHAASAVCNEDDGNVVANGRNASGSHSVRTIAKNASKKRGRKAIIANLSAIHEENAVADNKTKPRKRRVRNDNAKEDNRALSSDKPIENRPSIRQIKLVRNYLRLNQLRLAIRNAVQFKYSPTELANFDKK